MHVCFILSPLNIHVLIIYDKLAIEIGITFLSEISKRLKKYIGKGHSLYQISSKMLPGSKVITLVEKKEKR